MCSDKMRGLVTDLENAVGRCGKPATTIKDLSSAIINRAALLRAIDELERKLRGARLNAIEDGIEDQIYEERRFGDV